MEKGEIIHREPAAAPSAERRTCACWKPRTPSVATRSHSTHALRTTRRRAREAESAE